MAGETEIMVPAVDVAARSDPGRDPSKQVNEDACGHRETPFGVLAVVCDGMGGHVGGREASSSALATIFEAFEKAPLGATPREVLRDSIRLANVRVRGLALSDPAGGRPGSTVVAVLVHAAGTEVAHVGDSRVYMATKGQIFQITRDHSMVEEMVRAKILTPEQAIGHPEANKITRALGIDDDVNVDVRPQSLEHAAGDTFILCSDGLSDLVEPSDMLSIVGAAAPEQAAGQLVDLANARGGHDNVTAIVVRPRMSAMRAAAAVSVPVTAESQMVTLRPTGLRPPLAVIPAAPPPAPPPPKPAASRAPVVVGLALAAVGVVAAIVVLGDHIASRRASRGPTVLVEDASLGHLGRGAASVELTAVAPPEAVGVDASTVPPLEPAAPVPEPSAPKLRRKLH